MTLRHFFIFLVLFTFATTVSGQADTFNKSCKDAMFDSIIIGNGQAVKYKLVSKTYSHHDKDDRKVYNGEVVLLGFTADSDTAQVKNILNRLGIKYNIREFTAFPDCQSIDIYHSSLGIHKGKSDIIGTFKLDWVQQPTY